MKQTAVGTQNARMKVPTEHEKRQIAQLDQQIREVEQRFDESTPELRAAQKQWEQAQRERKPAWTTVEPTGLASNSPSIARREKGSAPIPYTVSVGRPTTSPRRSASRAAVRSWSIMMEA